MKSNAFVDYDSGLLRGAAEDRFFQELVDRGELTGLPAKYTKRAEELAAEGRVSIA